MIGADCFFAAKALPTNVNSASGKGFTSGSFHAKKGKKIFAIENADRQSMQYDHKSH